jgi:hypothetical protein
MLLTIQTEPLIKMVEIVGEGASGRRTNTVIRLAVEGDRVSAKCGETIAQGEAAVWESGQCTLSRDALLSRLKACRNDTEVTLQADQRRLCVNGMSIPVISYGPPTLGPEVFHVFMATEIGFISSDISAPAA